MNNYQYPPPDPYPVPTIEPPTGVEVYGLHARNDTAGELWLLLGVVVLFSFLAQAKRRKK